MVPISFPALNKFTIGIQPSFVQRHKINHHCRPAFPFSVVSILQCKTTIGKACYWKYNQIKKKNKNEIFFNKYFLLHYPSCLSVSPTYTSLSPLNTSLSSNQYIKEQFLQRNFPVTTTKSYPLSTSKDKSPYSCDYRSSL